MGKYIGIDLGTTFSVAAYIDENGNPQVIDNQEGENITASAVYFEDGRVIVGTDAKKESVMDSEHFIGFVKRDMGNKHIHYDIDGEQYKPEIISSFILKKIKNDVEKALNDEILGAVITVPAYFTDAQRTATKQAAKLAGIDVLNIINEPTAAALAYGITKNNQEKKKILVYDLGGGTFDVSIMEYDGTLLKVLSSMGDAELGGYDFDNCIVEWFINETKDEGIDLNDDLDAKQDLLMKAEEAKKSLSTGRNKVKITIFASGKKITKELTKEQFEEMIEPILYSTTSMMLSAMEEANLDYEDLDKVLLVGGSTRIPLVRQMILEETEIEPSLDIHPDEAVAIGAAFYAVECVKDKVNKQKVEEEEIVVEEKDIPQIQTQYKFIDRTSHGIGVVITNEVGEEVNSIVLPKNSVVPAKASQDYCTLSDYQEQILLRVTQGESTELKYTTIVGEAELKLRPKPKGSPIRVVISCDDNSLIHVHVIDLQDNENLGEMRIARNANMSDEEVEEVQQQIGKLNIGWED